MPGAIDRLSVAVVIVTHNRASLLQNLLLSLRATTRLPTHIIVVDNASSDDTQAVVHAAMPLFPDNTITNARQSMNIGGAGGFSVGVSLALETQAEWTWLIDDDVEVLDNGLERLLKWGKRFDCIHGQRLKADGTPFFFNPVFNEWLGVPLISFFKVPAGHYKRLNVGCFEGMLLRTDIARQIGAPDARFFLTWDDAIYGWLVSRHTPVILTSDIVLRKTRSQRQISLGVRHLNDASDSFRYHIMRNRYLVAEYLQAHGRLNRIGFGIGTALVFAKEVVRLTIVERRLSGLLPLIKGYVAYRTQKRQPRSVVAEVS